MDLQFQLHQSDHDHSPAVSGTTKPKGRSPLKPKKTTTTTTTKFVGVRQRPSGRWVAEIKGTTQKIRMWLGTFETAEEAARAYDEAACLLRGAGARTNFLLPARRPPPDSALTSRIRTLLSLHQLKKKHARSNPPPPPPPPPPSSTAITTIATAVPSASAVAATADEKGAPARPSDEEVRGPCFPGGFDRPGPANQQQSFFDGAFRRLPPAFDGFEPDEMIIGAGGGVANADHAETSEFERMTVERQISASLYAMNGVQEYYDMLHDAYCGGGGGGGGGGDALWDLSPLWHLSCRT